MAKIKIDSDQCVGCGSCVNECPEGLELKDGKAVVKDEKKCDTNKLKDVCPTGAIHIE